MVWMVAVVGFSAMALDIVLLFAYQNLFGVIYQKIGMAVAVFMAGLAAGGLSGRWCLVLLGRRGRECASRRLTPRRAVPEREMTVEADRNAPGSASRRALLVAAAGVLVLLMTASLVLPHYLKTLSAAEGIDERVLEAALLAAMGVVGMLTGSIFPLAGGLHLAFGEIGLVERVDGEAVTADTERPPRGGIEAHIGRTAGVIDAADHAGACLGALITGVVLVPVLGIARTTFVVAALIVTALAALWKK